MSDLAREARLTGLVGPVSLGVLEVTGPDAARFLQASVTNEVTALQPGQGNLSARVDRTGRLLHWFSVHALPESYLLVLEAEDVGALRDNLERYLFAEQVVLRDATADFEVLAVQGPASSTALSSAFDGEPWEALTEGAIVEVDGGWVVARSLTGDPGFILLATDGSAVKRVAACAAEAGLQRPPAAELAAALDVLRIEAGWLRVGPDTPGKPPLLPETGLEQHTVSYTKGCYLGQEIIARVRTYGSVKHALRALVFRGLGPTDLDQLPPAGELRLASGEKVGRITSRVFSPVAGAPVALGFVDRDHRTPGSTLELAGSHGGLVAEVVLMPLYEGQDRAARVEQHYDQAVRTFAAGDEAGAMALLEQTLRLDPAFEDGYEALGVILGRSGRFHEAIDLFKRLEELAPSEPMVNTNLSIFYMKLGDKPTAEAESARAMEKTFAAQLDTGDRDPAELALERQELRLIDARRKKDMFGMVLGIDPEDPVALFGLGSALVTLGEHSEAADLFARATTQDPNNSAAYLAHGKALESIGRDTEALAIYKSGREVASRRGDLMPLKEMEHRTLLLEATQTV